MADGDWDPNRKYRFYLKRIREILGEEKRTVRDVYYALEARGFPDDLKREWHRQYGHRDPDDQPNRWGFDYRSVKRAVKLGRRHGWIDPDLIVDTSRPTTVTPDYSHSDPEKFLKSNIRHIEHGYFLNYWDDQPCHVEVWLEKASLGSVFEPICEDYNVRLEATRGDWSDSKVNETTARLIRKLNDGRDIKIIYFGDFNPSGMHAPCAVQNTMEHYGMPFPFRGDGETNERYFDIWPWGRAEPMEYQNADGSIMFERPALNLEHIERFDLPENPTPSSTDKDRQLRDRFMEQVSEGRDVNIELNALKEFQREYLEELLRESIEQYVDDETKDETEERQEEEQERIREALGDVDYDVFDDE